MPALVGPGRMLTAHARRERAQALAPVLILLSEMGVLLAGQVHVTLQEARRETVTEATHLQALVALLVVRY